MAFADNGDFLIANFGTDCLEIMSRDGQSRVLADSIDGEPIGKVNFVLRDSQNRVWITVSTRIKNWMHALRTDLPDGYVARYTIFFFVGGLVVGAWVLARTATATNNGISRATPAIGRIPRLFICSSPS